jgi:hypothetical protein
MGVVKPYLPELDPPVQFDKSRIPKLNTFDFNSTSVWHRCLGAQQHYSFVEHLENNKFGRYNFNGWDYNYQGMDIHMIAMMGDDIN